jgi:hypothetical protein
MNPDFFKGTACEAAVDRLIERNPSIEQELAQAL